MTQTKNDGFKAKTGKQFEAMYARVIDADNNKILEWYDPKDERKILKKYEDMGRWEDVSVDRDGDIILWENL